MHYNFTSNFYHLFPSATGTMFSSDDDDDRHR